MTRPLITVGMTAYNAEDCILDTIRSIVAQTVDDWELIVVDDGSSDKTAEILNLINDPRIKILTPDGKNLKIPARRNQTIEHATGKYYAVMDADDMSHPLRFEKQINFLEKNHDIDVVGLAMCILDENKKPCYKTSTVLKHDEIFNNKFSNVRLANATVMAKTAWFKKWKYDPTIIRGEDQELWLRSEKQSLFANITEQLYFCNEFSYASARKYYIAQKYMAKVVWKYASVEKGKVAATKYVLEKYMKAAAYLFASLIGKGRHLIKRRFLPLSLQEKSGLEQAIEKIKNTEIPMKSPNKD